MSKIIQRNEAIALCSDFFFGQLLNRSFFSSSRSFKSFIDSLFQLSGQQLAIPCRLVGSWLKKHLKLSSPSSQPLPRSKALQ
jgi:hypothetical protein